MTTYPIVTLLTPSTGLLDIASIHRTGEVFRDHYRVLYAVIVHDREGADLTDCYHHAVIAFNPDGTVRELHHCDATRPVAALSEVIVEEGIRRARVERAAVLARMAARPAPPGAIALTCRAHEYAEQWSARHGGCCPVCGADGKPLVIPARVERVKSGDGVWITTDGSAVRWALEALAPMVTSENTKVMTAWQALYSGPLKAADLRARLQEIGWLAKDVVKVVKPGKTAQKTGLRMMKGGVR